MSFVFFVACRCFSFGVVCCLTIIVACRLLSLLFVIVCGLSFVGGRLSVVVVVDVVVSIVVVVVFVVVIVVVR